MPSRAEYITRMAADFERAREALNLSASDSPNLDIVAAVLVLAARLEAVEDALINGLPTAGEGI